jgi:vacuolar protein sorting-associated protein VTA1
LIENLLFVFQRSATSSAPETTQQPMSPPKDSTSRLTSLDSTSHRSFTQPSEAPPFQHSYSKSSEDFNLPSAPSNPIPPSYSQNSSYGAPDNAGYPSPYPHASGTPFDSPGGNPGPHTTIGTYSCPSDPPDFATSPPPSYSSYPPPRQDPAQYHQQQPQWPSSSPFSDPSSAYPSVFPSGGYQPAAPQYPSTPQAPHGASRHSEPPVGPESSTGYQLNGSYDSEYKPSAGTIVEAHKASRFAVSALAYDDVPTAIEHLRKSLELLTSPSASAD